MKKPMIVQGQRKILLRKIVKVKKKTVSPITVIIGAVTNMKIAVKKRQSLKEIEVGKIVNTTS